VRRYEITVLAAVVVVAVPYVWVLFDLWTGSFDGLRTVNNSGFTSAVYDIQARAMLHGHLSLPHGSIGDEAFVHDGRSYTYFGIWASILRMPILAISTSLQGRLTALSMLFAWVVTALFGAMLLWRLRVMTRGDARLSWFEATSYGLLLASILCGSVLVVLASVPNVYSEDLAWSVALACGSLFALVGVVERPNWRRVLATGVLVLITLLNRPTTGYASVAGTLAVAIWFALGRGGNDRRRWAPALFLAGLLALVVGCAVNYAKFGVLFGVPFSTQVLYRAFKLSQTNHGHYFDLKFLPATLQSYWSPTNLSVGQLFPYFTIPRASLHQVDNIEVFTRGPTASATASMPLLVLLSIWGVVTTFMRQRDVKMRSLRLLLVAAAISGGATMLYGWIYERFLADFMPVLVLAGMLGMVDLWRRLEGRKPAVRKVGFIVIVLGAAFGLLANVGIAVSPADTWTKKQAWDYVQAEKTLSDITGHPLDDATVRQVGFPPYAPTGHLLYERTCSSLYVSDGEGHVLFYPREMWVLVDGPTIDACATKSPPAGDAAAPGT
jgi:hypothetical protein